MPGLYIYIYIYIDIGRERLRLTHLSRCVQQIVRIMFIYTYRGSTVTGDILFNTIYNWGRGFANCQTCVGVGFQLASRLQSGTRLIYV